MLDQIVEIDVAIQAARCETHVILEPVDGPDFVHVALALVIGWTLSSVEVVNVHCVGQESCCEQVASVAEADFLASLDLDLLDLVERLGEHVHHQDLVI